MPIADTDRLMDLEQRIETLWTELLALECSIEEENRTKPKTVRLRKQQSQHLSQAKNDLTKLKGVLEAQLQLKDGIESHCLPSKLKTSDSIERTDASIQRLTIEADNLNQHLEKWQGLLHRASCNNLTLLDRIRTGAVRKSIYRLKKLELAKDDQKQRLDLYTRRLLRSYYGKLSMPVGDLLQQLQILAENADRDKKLVEQLEKVWSEQRRQYLYMKNWLEESRQQAQKRLPTQPPAVHSLQSLAGTMKKDEIEDYIRIKHRLTTAKSYLKHCLKKIELMPDQAPWQ